MFILKNAMQVLHRSLGETAAANDLYKTYETFIDNSDIGANHGQISHRELAEETWIVHELNDFAYILQGLRNCKFFFTIFDSVNCLINHFR